jgi:hypothetical protein
MAVAGEADFHAGDGFACGGEEEGVVRDVAGGVAFGFHLTPSGREQTIGLPAAEEDAGSIEDTGMERAVGTEEGFVPIGFAGIDERADGIERHAWPCRWCDGWD